MYYITSEQAKSIHKTTIEVSGGGITDIIHFGQLESVLQNIQNGTKQIYKFCYLHRSSFIQRCNSYSRY